MDAHTMYYLSRDHGLYVQRIKGIVRNFLHLIKTVETRNNGFKINLLRSGKLGEIYFNEFNLL
jgi:hypothetical protein